MFIGADGVAYEVMGTPQRVFNLLSAPAVSVNARFEAVPAEFKGEDITETVLGSVGVAFCDVRGGMIQFEIDVANGDISTRHLESMQPTTPSNQPPGNRSVGDRLKAAGVRFMHEWYECDLRWMACEWREASADTMPLDVPMLPRVRTGFSRVKLRGSSAQVEISRHAMVRLGNDTQSTAIDCQHFMAWPAALAACNSLLHGIAPYNFKEEWTLILAASSLKPGRDFFYFAQVIPERPTRKPWKA